MPLAIEVAFVLLSVLLLADWLTHRERRRGYLAVAFGSLTLLVLIAPSLSDAGPYGRPLIDLAILLFLLSGWALLMFRDSFIPLGARARGSVAVVIVLVAALAIFVELPTDTQAPHGALQTVALAAILVTWGICVVEPIVTLWLASRGRPAVEGARMRSLSLGYTGLVAVIMFGTLGGSLVIIDSDSSLLTYRGLSEEEAKAVAARAAASPQAGEVRSPPRGSPTLVIPLELQEGPGAMVVVAGAFTPLFGDDEVIRLRQYAGSITAGLDRVALSARIRDLEKAKTEFMNIASHELRGPMTVIKGYLTMLESGSLGTLTPKAMSILPLLIAKADEVNSMVEQMLEAARLEEDRFGLRKERR